MRTADGDELTKVAAKELVSLSSVCLRLTAYARHLAYSVTVSVVSSPTVSPFTRTIRELEDKDGTTIFLIQLLRISFALSRLQLVNVALVVDVREGARFLLPET